MINRTINRWWTVVAGFLGSALGAGTIMVYSYGILSVGIAAEFGWSREVLTANMTAFLVGSGLGTAALGWLIARYGIRGPSIVFTSIFGALFASVAWLPPEPWLFQCAFLILGIGGAACTAMPYAVAISGFFNTRRGLALGIVVAGSGLGSTLFPLVAQSVTTAWGWRAGFISIGLVCVIVPALGLAFLVRTPVGSTQSRGSTAARDHRRPIAELIFRNRDFWLIAIPILAVSVATFGAMATLVPFLRDAQISPVTVASVLASAGLCSWFGRLLIGYLLDHTFAPRLTAVIFVLAAAGLALLVTTKAIAPAYAGAALIGMAMGSEADLLAFLVSRYFRLVEFSRAIGAMWVVWAWGGSVGTFLAAQCYSLTQSYTTAYIGFIALLLVGASVILRLGPYHDGLAGEADRDPSDHVAAPRQEASPDFVA